MGLACSGIGSQLMLSKAMGDKHSCMMLEALIEAEGVAMHPLSQRMVDPPVIDQARDILDRIELFGGTKPQMSDKMGTMSYRTFAINL